MPNYKSYPNSINTPNRKTRKGLRNSTFIANKKMNKRTIARANRLKVNTDD